MSRVLNGSPKVSSAARKAVEQAIEACSYRANPHARSLASGRADAIAVLLTQPQSELFDDPTFSLLLQGVSDGLSGSDTGLVLLLAGNDEERRRTVRFLDSRHVDGIVHLSPHVDDPMLDDLLSSEVPVVLCGHHTGEEDPYGFLSVTVTDYHGGISAIEHLRCRGARRIAMIAGPVDAPGSIERVMGYRAAMAADFDPGLLVHGDYALASGRAALADLLDRHPDIDAVFCASDRMAAGAFQTAMERGLRIPQDLKVVGFDNHAIGLDLNPHLTTVAQPLRDLGRSAVEMLTKFCQGQTPENRVFPTELIVRASS